MLLLVGRQQHDAVESRQVRRPPARAVVVAAPDAHAAPAAGRAKVVRPTRRAPARGELAQVVAAEVGV